MNAPHPDVDELADLAEGLLEPNRSADIETHVHGCTDCAGLLAAVRAVPTLLADIPSPAMPPEAAERLEALLRAEATRRSEEAEAHAVPPTPLAARRPAGTWGARLRGLAAAAAAVAVLGGAVSLLGSQGSLSTSESADSSAEGGGVQMEREKDGVAGRIESARPDGQAASDLAVVARRLQARQQNDGAEGWTPLTATAGAVQGLRAGMAAS